MLDQTKPPVMLRRIHVEQKVTINASPERVFDALTRQVAAWWGTPYLLTAAPQTIILEPEVGGRLYEVSGEGEGALWGTVTAIQKNHRLELTGPVGMSGAMHSVVSFALEPQGEVTSIMLTHHAVGELREDTEANYGAGWHDLVAVRLKAFVETGERQGLQKS